MRGMAATSSAVGRTFVHSSTAGFFMIDCETRERAEEIAARFAQPGGTVELRPSMWGDGDDG